MHKSSFILQVKKLDEQRIENKRLQIDNEDLQHEFQREREGYLNTIRDQEKKIASLSYNHG